MISKIVDFFKIALGSKQLLIAGLLLSQVGYAGQKVGNGGDIIECKNDPSISIFSGWNTLDYVATYNHENNNQDIPQLTAEAHLSRIEKLLNLKIPSLGASFSAFLKDRFNLDKTHFRYWTPEHYQLTDIEDELIGNLPSNCIKGEKPQKRQAVVREQRPGNLIYHFDPEALDLIKDLGVQYSMIFVHEWLWDVAPNSMVIRDVNRVLHSDALEKYDVTTLRQVLGGLGIEFPDKMLMTMLFKAIEDRDQDRFKFALDRGADINAWFLTDINALQYAVGKDYPEMVKMILAVPNLDVNLGEGHVLGSGLHLALGTEKDIIAFEILNHPKVRVSIKSAVGTNSVHMAALFGMSSHLGVMSSKSDFIQALNAPDNQGVLPLHMAISRAHVQTVKTLLESGADKAFKVPTNSTLVELRGLDALGIAKLYYQQTGKSPYLQILELLKP